MDYQEFLERKRIFDPMTGMDDPDPMPASMKSHQSDITSWCLRRGRSAVFARPGLGKTLVGLEWARQVAEETGKPVLGFAPPAVANQHIREATKFGIEARIVRSKDDVKDGVNVTNYHKMHLFDMSVFGGIWLDECFVADTPVDCVDKSGKIYQKHIENVRRGEYISNAAGVDRVADIHRREVPYGIRVSFGGRSIISSPNHPFFTRSGWKGATDLEPGDEILATAEVVRMVQESVHSDVSGCREEKQILREILLSEMADESAGAHSESSYARSCGKARSEKKRVVQRRIRRGEAGISSYCCSKSHGGSRNQGEGIPHIERNEARTFRAWWQWQADDEAAASLDGCTVRKLDSGICFITGEATARISNLLQNRLSERRKSTRYRGGWSVSSFSQGSGCKEGCEIGGTRVDGIEILELGHPDLDRYRDADGKLYFYDITATQHPSFSIHGCLVHNSGILKNHSGHYRTELINNCSNIRFRLATTATPAPNDYMELGNHAEFLGVMSYTDMLATFFTHDGGETQKWRLKGHAEDVFWKWIASWCVMLRKPSDLGYDDTGYDLSPLISHQHTVSVPYEPSAETGFLFPMQARGLGERIKARRATISDRVQMAVDITPKNRPFVWWVNLNAESEALAKAIGATEIRGSDDDSVKERKLIAFGEGEIRRLVTKTSLTGHGLNWQHCRDTGFLGASDSWEQVYQAIHRFYRFGQTEEVHAHFIASELEGGVVANYRRKQIEADRMESALVKHMSDISSLAVRGALRDRPLYNPTEPMIIPSWLAA